MKKSFLFLWTGLGLLFFQCTFDGSGPDKPSKPRVDYDQLSIQLMKDLAPQIVGTWKLQHVRVKHQSYNVYQRELKINNDTTFQDLAVLTIKPAAVPRSSPRDLRQGEYDGTIEYGGKTYPIQFDMLASTRWLVEKKGPQTFFLFDYHFPNGSHLTEPEENFLKNLGLVGDNFSLETTIGQRTMTWRGLNRGVEQMTLVRQ